LNSSRKGLEAARRLAERRSLEEGVPRLRQQIPRLLTLHFEIDDRRVGGAVGTAPRYIRRIVVENAVSLFIVGCGDDRCKDGGHDITYSVMSALRAGETRFEGDDECIGSQGLSRCDRAMHYVAVATYATESP